MGFSLCLYLYNPEDYGELSTGCVYGRLAIGSIFFQGFSIVFKGKRVITF